MVILLARVAELVDALGSGSSLLWEVLVQVQSRALKLIKLCDFKNHITIYGLTSRNFYKELYLPI